MATSQDAGSVDTGTREYERWYETAKGQALLSTDVPSAVASVPEAVSRSRRARDDSPRRSESSAALIPLSRHSSWPAPRASTSAKGAASTSRSRSPWADSCARRGQQGHPIYRSAHFHTRGEVEHLLSQGGFRIVGVSLHPVHRGRIRGGSRFHRLAAVRTLA